MTDIDYCHSFRTKLPDNVEQPIRLTIGESRRRFVHYEDPTLVEQRARNLDLLLLGNRKMSRALGGPKPGAEPIQDLLGSSIHFGGVFDEPETF
jgi:hypothetical protein